MTFSAQFWKQLGCHRAVFALMALVVAMGCERVVDELPAKKPRPVEVKTLAFESPLTQQLVTASVASWKTEDIGFEVAGRIDFVVEQNTDIEGHIVDSDGIVLVEGTPIATIEKEKFQLQLDSATAEVARAEQSVNALNIEIEKSLPSQMRAAEAERKLAQTERDRSQRLVNQNAAAQADVDRDEANYQTALARLEQLAATEKSKQADLVSLELQVDKAKQAQRDAERNLEDCTLYSSFRGQIAKVHVVPGSVVSAGTPVATVQMMDPIKIELEVSGETSRKLRERQRLSVLIPQTDGPPQEHDGFLYLIDPVADPQTRTFTLTLLMLNQRSTSRADAYDWSEVARTDQCWRVDFSFLPGSEKGMTFAIEEAIHEDGQGHFVWRIDNMKHSDAVPKDGLLNVSKVRVEKLPFKLPFLGNWIFQQIRFVDGSFDPAQNLIAGRLSVQDGDADAWSGNTVVLDRGGQWMVRPGDLVTVNLSVDESEPGFHVAMDAIAYEAGRTFLFLVESTSENAVVQKTEIRVVKEMENSAISSIARIEPVDTSLDLSGRQYVSRGVHYLRDQEAVNITVREESQ